MKRFFRPAQVIFYMGMLLLLHINSNAQSWYKKANCVARFAPVSFSINGKVYAGGGYSDLYAASGESDFYEFDPATDIWTKKADLPGGIDRTFATGFSINGKGYICMGASHFTNFSTISSPRDLWEYDPSSDSWTRKADFIGNSRFAASSFVVNNKAYVIGGDSIDFTDHFNDMYEYDPALDTWTKKASYPDTTAIGIDYPFAFAIGNKGYISAGLIPDSAGDLNSTDKTYEYDPTTDSWTEKSPFLGGQRREGFSFAWNGKGYCGAGVIVEYSYLNDFYSYNPTTDTWAKEADFPGVGREYAIVTATNDAGYIGSGYAFHEGVADTNLYYNDFYRFSDSAGPGDSSSTWVPVVKSYNSISCYPNPATDVLYVQVPNQTDKYKYILYDVLGQKVLYGDLSSNKNIDIKNIPSGIYILKLSSSTESFSANVNIFHRE